MHGLHPLLNEQPAFLPDETDTATQRTLIPIFYIHSLTQPFCGNPLCACQRNSREFIRLFGYLTEGMLTLHEAARFSETEIGVPMSDLPDTSSTTDTKSGHNVMLTDESSVSCSLYGHEWEVTETTGVKVCRLCGVRGYCPGCTPVAPHGALPFFCTAHTPREGR